MKITSERKLRLSTRAIVLTLLFIIPLGSIAAIVNGSQVWTDTAYAISESRMSANGTVVYRRQQSSLSYFHIYVKVGDSAGAGIDITSNTTIFKNQCSNPNISPNGRYVVFDASAMSRADVYCYDVTTPEIPPVKLTGSLTGKNVNPVVSDDGYVVFRSNAQTTTESIKYCTVSGGGMTTLINASASVKYPAISGDGQSIAVIDATGISVYPRAATPAASLTISLTNVTPSATTVPSLNYDGTVMAYTDNGRITVRMPDANTPGDFLTLDIAAGSAPCVSSRASGSSTDGDGRFVTYSTAAGAIATKDFAYGSTLTISDAGERSSVSRDGLRYAYSDGANVYKVEVPKVTIRATDAAAAEGAEDTGTFTVTRSGGTVGSLTVNLAIAGTAEQGDDYSCSNMSGSAVVIPNGATEVTITVTPADDTVLEGDETAILSVLSSTAYILDITPETTTDTVTIADDIVSPAPSDLTATATSETTIALTWTNHAENATGIAVERRKLGDGEFALIDTVDADATTFLDTGLSDGTGYAYRVRALGTVNSAYSDTADVQTKAIVTIARTADAAEPSTAGTFTISRSGDASGVLTVSYTVSGTAVSGTDYTALSGSVEIPDGQASVTIQVTPMEDDLFEDTETVIVLLSANEGYVVGTPDTDTITLSSDTSSLAPSNLTAVTASGVGITLAWHDNSGNETGFEIQRRTGTGPFNGLQTVGENIITFTDTTVQPGTTYSYRVCATSAVENSAYTDDATATTLPMIVDDTYTVNAGATLTVAAPGVLANDGSADYSTLNTALVSGEGKGPDHGTVTNFQSDGAFTYTPAPGFSGTDHFTYTVNTGEAFTNQATVHITVNAAPEVGGARYTINQDTVLTTDATNGIAAFVTDADNGGEAFSFVLVGGEGNGPNHGTITNFQSDGSFTYTPDAGYAGTDFFTFTVSDGSATATGVVNITMNTLPTLAAIAAQSTDMNVPLSNIPLTVGDAEDVTTVELLWSATGTPDGLVEAIAFTGTGASRTMTITPGTNKAGTATVTVTAKDRDNGIVSRDFTLTVHQTYRVTTRTVSLAADGVTVIPDEVGGEVSPSNAVDLYENGYQFYTATPNMALNYGLFKWVVDEGTDHEVTQTAGLTYDLSKVAAPHSLTVYFKKDFLAPTLATLNGVTHLVHDNVGEFPVTLVGTGFRAGATVFLTRAGSADITATHVVVSADGQTITCNFNFTRNATEDWDVVVRNDDGKTAQLGSAISLENAAPHLTSVSPATGMRDTTVVVDLVGYGFSPNATAVLTNGTVTKPFTSVTFCDQTWLRGTVTLPSVAGTTAETWNVVVTNPDQKPTTELVPFSVGPYAAPSITGISQTWIKKAPTGRTTATFTLNGAEFRNATVTLHPTGATTATEDVPMTVSVASTTQLTCTRDITDINEGQYDVIVTNDDGQQVTRTKAYVILPAGLTVVTLAVDRPMPQPCGSTMTLTATKSGASTNIEYAFYAKVLNTATQVWTVTTIRDFSPVASCTWKPGASGNYYVYVGAREGNSGPAQVFSVDSLYRIEDGTITAVTMTTTKLANGTMSLVATPSGTAENVEYRFYGYKRNPMSGKLEYFDIRGYDTVSQALWTPTVNGQFYLGVLARVVGNASAYQQSSALSSCKVTWK